MSSAVAWSPSSTAIGSPDAARVRTKTMTATSAITTSMPMTRDKRYRVMTIFLLRSTQQAVLVLESGVPEERPGGRHVALQRRRLGRQAVELADVDVRHFVIHHLLHRTPE